ncbi:MAG: hypothetical protein ACHQ9S_07105 [Candidatus Binatia bacterium]
MKWPRLSLSLIILLAAGCGGNGAPRFGGAAPAATLHFDLDCTICHTADVPPGTEQPGQPLPACNIAACHHHPQSLIQHRPAGPGSVCTDCHKGHQSSNLFLVREEILTPSGVQRAVEFTNADGVADGSFVSVTPPVRGLCQVCHTTTQFYRADGSGDTHFTFPCYSCHSHTKGFLP